jgi:hypothetical protein
LADKELLRSGVGLGCRHEVLCPAEVEFRPLEKVFKSHGRMTHDKAWRCQSKRFVRSIPAGHDSEACGEAAGEIIVPVRDFKQSLPVNTRNASSTGAVKSEQPNKS